MNSRVLRNLRIFYNIAVEAVKPENLINDSVKISNNVLSIQDKYELTLNNNCYVVGLFVLLVYCNNFIGLLVDKASGKQFSGWQFSLRRPLAAT